MELSEVAIVISESTSAGGEKVDEKAEQDVQESGASPCGANIDSSDFEKVLFSY